MLFADRFSCYTIFAHSFSYQQLFFPFLLEVFVTHKLINRRLFLTDWKIYFSPNNKISFCFLSAKLRRIWQLIR